MSFSLKDFARLIDPLWRRVLNMVSGGIVRKVDDTGSFQTAQIEVLKGELRDQVEVFQPYGFASNPPVPDANNPEALIVRKAGSPDLNVIVAIGDRRYRLRNLASEEVAVYDAQGSSIVLKQNGEIWITSAANKIRMKSDVTIEAGLVVTGDVHSQGTVRADADVIAHRATLGDDVSLKGHVHGVNAVDGNTLPVVFSPPSNPAVSPSGTTGTPNS